MRPLLSAVLATAFAASAAAEPSGDTTWYSISSGRDTQIGHASHSMARVSDGVEIVDEQEIDIEQEGSPSVPLSWRAAPRVETLSWHTLMKEDLNGRPLSISSRSQTGTDWSRRDAHFEDGTAVITRTTPSETRTVSVALPSDVVFDAGEALIAAWNPATTPRLEFQEFDVDAMAVEHVIITPVASAAADSADGLVALRERFEGNDLRAVTRITLDNAHHIVEVVQPMFGSSLVTRLADQKTALGAHWALRPLANTMTKSPYRMSQEATRGHIRYVFSFRDGIQFPFPQTGEQRAAEGGGHTTLDICADCGPGLPSDPATLADALRPTPWLQSDDARIRAVAEPIAKLPVSDARKMEMLIEKGKPFLGRVDFVGHYSALETMSRHAADCTDAAVLLAALGRAAGIPTRVASGLVYSRETYHGISNAFMPHSWTLAWVDGKWRSFDLALDDFDSTHIAVTIGDGDEMSVLAAGQLAGLLNWDSMVEVRTSVAN